MRRYPGGGIPMRRSLLFLAWAFTVTACTPDVRTIELDSLDLRDNSTIRNIRSQLNATERRAFASFLVRHITTSAGYCGRPLAGEDGRPPVTVGEAINLSIAREQMDRLAYQPARANQPQSDEEEERTALLLERDDLMSARMFLRAEADQTLRISQDLVAIEERIVRLERRVALLDP